MKKTRLVKKRFNSKVFADLKNLQGRVKAGYPVALPSSHEADSNGHTPLQKAHAINYTNKNFIPFLLISFDKNKNKYQKQFLRALKFNDPAKREKKIDLIGAEMVQDIKDTLSEIQQSPTSSNKGCLFGAVKFVKE